MAMEKQGIDGIDGINNQRTTYVMPLRFLFSAGLLVASSNPAYAHQTEGPVGMHTPLHHPDYVAHHSSNFPTSHLFSVGTLSKSSHPNYSALHPTSNTIAFIMPKTDSIASGTNINLDLTSTSADIILGANVFQGSARSVTIDVGGTKTTYSAGASVTAGEYVAIVQALSGAGQAITLSSSGAATGGSFSLNAVDKNNNVSAVTIPTSVTAVDHVTKSALSISGDLINYGTLDLLSNSRTMTTGSISALDITNELGATIAATNAVKGASVSLTLDAGANISNAGSITASGAQALNAAGSITNSGSVAAANNVSLTTGSGNLTNTGTITSTGGNINIASTAPATYININAVNGLFSANSGNININNPHYSGTGNVNLNGGNWVSENLNIYAPNGQINGLVGQMTGRLNTVAAVEHLSASTANYILGDNAVKGDPIFVNNAGSITISGVNTFAGDLAIIASQNIVTSGSSASIVDPGSSVMLITGASVTSINGGSAVSTISGSPASPITSVTIQGGSSTGGFIDLSSNTTGTVINTSNSATSGNLNGGSVLLAAFTNGGNAGYVRLNNVVGQNSINTSGSPGVSAPGSGNGGSFGGSGGNVTIIAGGLDSSGTAASGGAIFTAGGSSNTNAVSTSGGSVSIIASQPVTNSASVSGQATIIAPGDLQAGSTISSALFITPGANISIGKIITAGGGGILQPQNLGNQSGFAGAAAGNITIQGNGNVTTGALDAYGGGGGGSYLGNGGSGGGGGSVSIISTGGNVNINGDVNTSGGGGGAGFGGPGGVGGNAGNVSIQSTTGTLQITGPVLAAGGGAGGAGNSSISGGGSFGGGGGAASLTASSSGGGGGFFGGGSGDTLDGGEGTGGGGVFGGGVSGSGGQSGLFGMGGTRAPSNGGNFGQAGVSTVGGANNGISVFAGSGTGTNGNLTLTGESIGISGTVNSFYNSSNTFPGFSASSFAGNSIAAGNITLNSMSGNSTVTLAGSVQGTTTFNTSGAGTITTTSASGFSMAFLNFSGQSLAIISAGGMNVSNISLNTGTGNGGNLTLIADTFFSPFTTNGPPPITGTTFSGFGSSGNAGDININFISTLTGATGGVGGSVVAVAYDGAVNIISVATGASAGGTAGAVQIIAQGINVGVFAGATSPSGPISLLSATPVSNGASVLNGVLSGSFSAQAGTFAGNIVCSGLNASHSTVTVTTGGAGSISPSISSLTISAGAANLTAGTGGIGQTSQVTVNTQFLSANAPGGTVNIVDTASNSTLINGSANLFSLTGVNNIGTINANVINLANSGNGNINIAGALQGAVSGTNSTATTITANGSGSINAPFPGNPAILTNTLLMTSGTGTIGTSASPIQTNASSLALTTGNTTAAQGIYVFDTNTGTTTLNASSSGSNLAVTTLGSLAVVGSISSGTPGAMTLASLGGDIIVAASLNANGGVLSVTALGNIATNFASTMTGANINLTAQIGSIILGANITASDANSTDTGINIASQTSGSILAQNGAVNLNTGGSGIILSANTGDIGSSSVSIHTNAPTIQVTTSGNIFINDQPTTSGTTVTVANAVDSATFNLTTGANASTMSLGSITANSVTLTTAGGTITTSGTISASTLNLNVGSGIAGTVNTPLTVSATTLNVSGASATQGSVFINDGVPATIGTTSVGTLNLNDGVNNVTVGGPTISPTANNLTVATTGSITIATSTLSAAPGINGNGGTIDFSASSVAGATGNTGITLNANGTGTGSGGTITLAGLTNALTLGGNAANDITLNVNAGSGGGNGGMIFVTTTGAISLPAAGLSANATTGGNGGVIELTASNFSSPAPLNANGNGQGLGGFILVDQTGPGNAVIGTGGWTLLSAAGGNNIGLPGGGSGINFMADGTVVMTSANAINASAAAGSKNDGGSISITSNSSTTFNYGLAKSNKNGVEASLSTQVAGAGKGTAGNLNFTNLGGAITNSIAVSGVGSFSMAGSGAKGSVTIGKSITTSANGAVDLTANGGGSITGSQLITTGTLDAATTTSGTGSIGPLTAIASNVTASAFGGTVTVTDENVSGSTATLTGANGSGSGKAFSFTDTLGNIATSTGTTITSGSLTFKASGTGSGDGNISLGTNTIIKASGASSTVTLTATGSTSKGGSISAGTGSDISGTKGVTLTASEGTAGSVGTGSITVYNLGTSTTTGAVKFTALNAITENNQIDGLSVALSQTAKNSTTGTGITVNNIATTNGAISATAAGAALDVNGGGTVTAGGKAGVITLTDSNLASNINIGSAAQIETTAAAAGKGTVTIAIGTASTAAGTNGTPPAVNYNIAQPSKSVFFVQTTGVALSATGKGNATDFNSLGGGKIFISNSKGSGKVTIQGGTATQDTVIAADPPAVTTMLPGPQNSVRPGAYEGMSTSQGGTSSAPIATTTQMALPGWTLIPGAGWITDDTNTIASASRVLYGSATANGAPAETMFISKPQSAYGLIDATLVGGSGMGIEPSDNVEMTQVNAEGNNVIKLSKGHVLVAPEQDTVIETAFGNVEAKARSLVLVMALPHGTAVYNLDDTCKNAVVVKIGSKRLALAPGRHAMVTPGVVDGYEMVNPIESIGYRNILGQRFEGFHAFTAEFSMPSAISNVKQLRALVASKHPEAKKLADHMLKTTAIISQLAGGKGGAYQQFPHPCITAMAK